MIKNILMNTAAPITLFSDVATDTGGASEMQSMSQKERVQKIVNTLAEHEEFSAHLRSASDAKLNAQYSVMQCAIDLDMIFGEDELREWPVPGSETGNNPDKYTILVKVDGEMKSKKVDFYSEIVERMPRGRELVSIIEAVTVANKNSGNCDHPAVTMLSRPEDRNDLRNQCRQELSVYKSTIRSAMKYYQTTWAIESMPKVAVTLLMEPVYETVIIDGKQSTQAVKDGSGEPVMRPRRTPKPIKVYDANDATAYELYSMTSFSTLNVEDAKAKGGTFEALKATKQRERDEGDDDGIDGDIQVSNLDQAFSAFGAMAGWTEKDENCALLLKKLKADPTGKLAEIESIREFYINLTGIMPAINKLWDKEQERIDTERKAKTAA